MIWLGVLLVSAVVQADSMPRALTLQEALELAQRNAPQAIQALGQTRTSAAAVRSAYAAFLPSVSVSAGATRQYPSRGGGTRVENGQVITLPEEPWSYSRSIGANVELFGGGQRIFDLQQARAGADAARANRVAQRYAIALAVKQGFYDVLAARESEEAARAQLEEAEQQFRAAVARVRAKTATRSDSLRSEIQLRNARLALMEALSGLDVANAYLTRVVGADHPVTAVAQPPETPALALEQDALRLLAEDGPAVRQARADLAAARAARRTSWTAYLPTVTASYSRSGSGTDTDFGLGADAYAYAGALRLSASLPLFNQLQRESQVVRAQVAEDNAVAALRDTRLAARQGLEQALGAFDLAGQRVAAQTASLEAAEEDLRVQRQRYALGSSTLLDVLTSQSQLDQARQSLIRARYDQRVAKAQLESLVGRDL